MHRILRQTPDFYKRISYSGYYERNNTAFLQSAIVAAGVKA